MRKTKYNPGQKLHNWTLNFYTSNGKWNCTCSCGITKEVIMNHIVRGNSTRCRACYGESTQTISSKYPREYNSWNSMKQHCKNQNDDRYQSYGGRGITYASSWEFFENFINDMGERPKNTSLDRINNNLGYFKENCRWAIPKEQSNNTRVNVLTIEQINVANSNGIKLATVKCRIKRGWNVKSALNTPLSQGKHLDVRDSKCG